MTVVVVRNLEPRFAGFLASLMLELTPGVYTAPRMTRAVRERVWDVLFDWFRAAPREGSIVMTWQDRATPTGQRVRILGEPARDLVDYDGFVLTLRHAQPDS